MEKKFATGLYYDDPHQNAPEWIVGSITVKRDEFIEYLQRQEASDKGYVKFDIKRSKEGKLYCELNDYKING